MELTKRFCRYLKKSLSRDEETNQKKLQEMPVEILVKLLGELPVVEAIALKDSCRSLRLAAILVVGDKLAALRKSVKSGIARLKSDVVCGLLDSGTATSKLLGAFCLRSVVHGELAFLDVVLRPYRRDPRISSALVKPIAAIVHESTTVLQAQSALPTESEPLPCLNRFLKRFHTQIEVHFYFSEHSPFFERKLFNVFFTCSRANHKITVSQKEYGYFISDVYFDLRVDEMKLSLPDVRSTNTRFENEREILKFILGYLREANLMYYRSLSSEIESLSLNTNLKTREHVIDKFITNVDLSGDCELEINKHLKSDNGVLQHTYENCSDTNISKWGVICSFKMDATDNRLRESSHKVPLVVSHCSVCTHPQTENNLRLYIYFEKNNSVLEVLIYYDSSLKNYSLCMNGHKFFLPSFSQSFSAS